MKRDILPIETVIYPFCVICIGIVMEIIKHKRISNKYILKEMRKSYCEYCGRRCNIEPHHVYSRGSGGGDIRENLIQLCSECHRSTHSGNKPSKEDCLLVIGQREGKTIDTIHKINRRAMGYKL